MRFFSLVCYITNHRDKKGENMKKISFVALLSMLTMPVFAEDVSALSEENLKADSAVENADSELGTTEVKENIVNEPEVVVQEEVSNPKIKFPHGLQLGVGVSATSGLNGFVGYANKNFDSFWWKRFGVRLDFASTAPVKSLINSGIDSLMSDGIEIGDGLSVKEGAIEGQHMAALLDFYPFGNTWFLGGIRITGGYYFGELDLSANLTGKVDGLPDSEFAFDLNGQQYKYVGNEVHGTANANWNYRGPYLGAGFDFGLFAGFKIYMDAGVVFTNKTAQLGLDLPTENLQKWDGGQWKPVELGGVAEFEQAKQDVLVDAQEELDKLNFYPMVKIGFMYRF